ncbi:F0F1 ATP synthase subunit delta [Celeribacter neptunius]|uniref:ATP synthase subunit b n=1 Tax=Celeribacter neptunius TaxID=588602 RepID=A0A1I3NU67_9RHOB|nr:F0F1 ATP synthase subunit delta [Celeribacter neptunius]SFJ12672.1 ATP synthase F0 subcomplex B subunit [Celeribacter neptunius]
MHIDWWTLGLQTINAVILIWILARFLFRPVARMLDERQAVTQAALDAAEAAQQGADRARATAEAEAEALNAAHAARLAEARDAAAREKSRLMAETEAALEKARDAAEAELAGLRRAQQGELRDKAGTLALEIAERLLSRLPDPLPLSGFIDGLAEAVAELPEATRTELGRTGPIGLRAAAEPTEAEREALKSRLGTVLGRPVEIDVTTDPGLIAGLELDASTAMVRNNLRADLERIKAELSDE